MIVQNTGHIEPLVAEEVVDYKYNLVEETFAVSVPTSLCLTGDWLLPPLQAIYTEPDIYEQILGGSGENSLILISRSRQRPTAVKTVENEEVPKTVTLSDVLPFTSTGYTGNQEKQLSELPEKEIVADELKQQQTFPISCGHCQTSKTSLWRRSGSDVVCNACALYEKLHGVRRPAHLLNQTIRRRNRGDTSQKKRKTI